MSADTRLLTQEQIVEYLNYIYEYAHGRVSTTVKARLGSVRGHIEAQDDAGRALVSVLTKVDRLRQVEYAILARDEGLTNKGGRSRKAELIAERDAIVMEIAEALDAAPEAWKG